MFWLCCVKDTDYSIAQICQCISLCALRLYCEECGKQFKDNDDFRKHIVSVQQDQ